MAEACKLYNLYQLVENQDFVLSASLEKDNSKLIVNTKFVHSGSNDYLTLYIIKSTISAFVITDFGIIEEELSYSADHFDSQDFIKEISKTSFKLDGINIYKNTDEANILKDMQEFVRLAELLEKKYNI